jgi:hypothetical protein
MEAGEMNMSTADELEWCFICSKSPDEHAEGEAAGKINHKYSTTSRLERVSRKLGEKPAPKSPTAVQIMVVPAPDIALRRLLVETGLLTREQIASMADLAGVVKVPDDAGASD